MSAYLISRTILKNWLLLWISLEQGIRTACVFLLPLTVKVSWLPLLWAPISDENRELIAVFKSPIDIADPQRE